MMVNSSSLLRNFEALGKKDLEQETIEYFNAEYETRTFTLESKIGVAPTDQVSLGYAKKIAHNYLSAMWELASSRYPCLPSHRRSYNYLEKKISLRIPTYSRSKDGSYIIEGLPTIQDHFDILWDTILNFCGECVSRVNVSKCSIDSIAQKFSEESIKCSSSKCSSIRKTALSFFVSILAVGSASGSTAITVDKGTNMKTWGKLTHSAGTAQAEIILNKAVTTAVGKKGVTLNPKSLLVSESHIEALNEELSVIRSSDKPILSEFTGFVRDVLKSELGVTITTTQDPETNQVVIDRMRFSGNKKTLERTDIEENPVIQTKLNEWVNSASKNGNIKDLMNTVFLEQSSMHTTFHISNGSGLRNHDVVFIIERLNEDGSGKITYHDVEKRVMNFQRQNPNAVEGTVFVDQELKAQFPANQGFKGKFFFDSDEPLLPLSEFRPCSESDTCILSKGSAVPTLNTLMADVIHSGQITNERLAVHKDILDVVVLTLDGEDQGERLAKLSKVFSEAAVAKTAMDKTFGDVLSSDVMVDKLYTRFESIRKQKSAKGLKEAFEYTNASTDAHVAGIWEEVESIFAGNYREEIINVCANQLVNGSNSKKGLEELNDVLDEMKKPHEERNEKTKLAEGLLDGTLSKDKFIHKILFDEGFMNSNKNSDGLFDFVFPAISWTWVQNIALTMDLLVSPMVDTDIFSRGLSSVGTMETVTTFLTSGFLDRDVPTEKVSTKSAMKVMSALKFADMHADINMGTFFTELIHQGWFMQMMMRMIFNMVGIYYLGKTKNKEGSRKVLLSCLQLILTAISAPGTGAFLALSSVSGIYDHITLRRANLTEEPEQGVEVKPGLIEEQRRLFKMLELEDEE